MILVFFFSRFRLLEEIESLYLFIYLNVPLRRILTFVCIIGKKYILKVYIYIYLVRGSNA